jgi:hypothetical protein
MDPAAIVLLLISALVGGVIGVWQARRRVHMRVRAHIEQAVEARLIERFGRRDGTPPATDAAKDDAVPPQNRQS